MKNEIYCRVKKEFTRTTLAQPSTTGELNEKEVTLKEDTLLKVVKELSFAIIFEILSEDENNGREIVISFDSIPDLLKNDE